MKPNDATWIYKAIAYIQKNMKSRRGIKIVSDLEADHEQERVEIYYNVKRRSSTTILAITIAEGFKEFSIYPELQELTGIDAEKLIKDLDPDGTFQIFRY